MVSETSFRWFENQIDVINDGIVMFHVVRTFRVFRMTRTSPNSGSLICAQLVYNKSYVSLLYFSNTARDASPDSIAQNEEETAKLEEYTKML